MPFFEASFEPRLASPRPREPFDGTTPTKRKMVAVAQTARLLGSTPQGDARSYDGVDLRVVRISPTRRGVSNPTRTPR